MKNNNHMKLLGLLINSMLFITVTAAYAKKTVQSMQPEYNFSLYNATKQPVWVVVVDKFGRKRFGEKKDVFKKPIATYQGIYLAPGEYQRAEVDNSEPVQVGVYTRNPLTSGLKKITMDYDRKRFTNPTQRGGSVFYINPKFTPNPNHYFYIFPQNKLMHFVWNGKELTPYASLLEYLKNQNLFYDNVTKDDIEDLSGKLLHG